MIKLSLILATAAALVVAPCSALLSCDSPLEGGNGTASSAVGTWYLLHCFTDQANKCTERNCLRFDLVTPEERKQLTEVYAARMSAVKWSDVVLKIVSPCPTPDAAPLATPNYLERQAPGSYKLISLPLGGKAVKVPKPRPMRLELVSGQFLVMLDCADLEPVVMAQRAPPPGYTDNPALAALLAYSDY